MISMDVLIGQDRITARRANRPAMSGQP